MCRAPACCLTPYMQMEANSRTLHPGLPHVCGGPRDLSPHLLPPSVSIRWEQDRKQSGDSAQAPEVGYEVHTESPHAHRIVNDAIYLFVGHVVVSTAKASVFMLTFSISCPVLP